MNVEVKVRHLKDGVEVDLVCEQSGMVLTRTNEYGMFCDAARCVCEEKSKEMTPTLDFIKAMASKPWG